MPHLWECVPKGNPVVGTIGWCPNLCVDKVGDPLNPRVVHPFARRLRSVPKESCSPRRMFIHAGKLSWLETFLAGKLPLPRPQSCPGCVLCRKFRVGCEPPYRSAPSFFECGATLSVLVRESLQPCRACCAVAIISLSGWALLWEQRP